MSPSRATWRKDPDSGLYRRAWYGGRPGYMEPGACEPCCEPGEPPPECCDIPINEPGSCAGDPECEGTPPGTSGCCSGRRCQIFAGATAHVVGTMKMQLFQCCPSPVNGFMAFPAVPDLSINETISLPVGCTAGLGNYTHSSGTFQSPCNCGGAFATSTTLFVRISASGGIEANISGMTPQSSGSCTAAHIVITETTPQTGGSPRPCPSTSVCWARKVTTIELMVTTSGVFSCPQAASLNPESPLEEPQL